MDKCVFYQDNQSAIKMEKNGMKFSGNRTRHIITKYFIIKDILKNEQIKLEHCRTDLMLADYLTKPLQGSSFKRMRDIIMVNAPFSVEERVGN